MGRLSASTMRKRAFYVTADFWKEQAEGKLVERKSDWNRWDELDRYAYSCAFCRYQSCNTDFIREGREACVLGGQNGSSKYCAKGTYIKWLESDSEQVRISAAKKIWKDIKAYMEEEYPEYFKKVGKWE